MKVYTKYLNLTLAKFKYSNLRIHVFCNYFKLHVIEMYFNKVIRKNGKSKEMSKMISQDLTEIYQLKNADFFYLINKINFTVC